MNADELKHVCKSFHLPVNHKRQDLVAALIEMTKSSQTRIVFTSSTKALSCTGIKYDEEIARVVLQLTGPLVMFCHNVRAIMDRIFGLYFLDDPSMSSNTVNNSGFSTQATPSSNLTVAILASLGKTVYPNFKIIITRPVFKDRNSWLKYEEAVRLQSNVDTVIENGHVTVDQLNQWNECCRLALGQRRAEVIAIDLEEDGDNHAISDSGVNETPYFLRRYSSEWVYLRILGALAVAYEKLKQHVSANSLYTFLLSRSTLCCRSSRGKWWVRCIINLCTHIKDESSALDACTAAINDPHVRMGRKLWIETRLSKLQQKMKNKDDESVLEFEETPSHASFSADDEHVRVITIYADAIAQGSVGSKLQFARPGFDTENGLLPVSSMTDISTTGPAAATSTDSSSVCSVEELALHNFLSGTLLTCTNEPWTGGFHCEARVLTTLFVLVFWDIIFGDMPDVFQHPFQIAPLDLYTDSFYNDGRRTVAISNRLLDVKCGFASSILAESYYSYYGQQAVGVSWSYSLADLSNVCYALGGDTLHYFFQLFAQDFKHTCSGIPDLLLYYVHNPDDDHAIEAAAVQTSVSTAAGAGATLSVEDAHQANRNRYLLVEVKSVNDQLSDAQKNWNALFLKNGVHIALCRVLPVEYISKKRRKSKV